MRRPPKTSVELPAPLSDVPHSTERRISPSRADDTLSEDDRVTPSMGLPAARSSSPSGKRAPRLTLEVNDLVSLESEATSLRDASSERPTPQPLSARATRILGSMAPPILAPGSRKTPSVGSDPPSGTPSTRYRYVSTPPPAGTPTSERSPGPASRGRKPPPERAPAPRRAEATAVIERPPVIAGQPPIVARTVAEPWRPDLSLLPESRRNLSDELYPLAVDGCWVVTVLATEGAEARSRLAAEIALVLAESGHPRVLLIDADFQNALVRRFLRAEMPIAASFSEQLQAPTPHRWTVVECLPSLHLLAESAHGTRAPIAAEPLALCLSELRSFYDFVVIDGPLLSDIVACEAVRDVVDGVVFSHGRYGPSEVTRIHSLFPSKPISLVPAVG